LSRAVALLTGAFDNLGLRHVRLLHESSRAGDVTVLLWTDGAVAAATGEPPKFGFAERRYLLASLRFVTHILAADHYREPWRGVADVPHGCVVCVDPRAPAPEADAGRRAALALGASLHPIDDRQLEGFPDHPRQPSDPSKKRVIVTGCFDWLHSGHMRFFEEVSGYGELYVVVGHDANVRLLKGDGHPRFPQEQRRYMTGVARYVHRSLISTGSGWMDAEPEVQTIGAQVYAVNEDGDKPEKREFCRTHGLEYLVLKRVPAAGLPPRSSTDLRGF